MFSSTFPSFLLPALPFAFVSQSEDYVTSTAFRNITPSSDIQLTRHYYKKHIEDIKNQLDRVKELGPASAEEWTKGLKTVGKEKLNDSARWEQWEEKGGLKKVNVRPSSKFVGRGGKATSVSTPTTKLSMSSNDSNPRAQAVNPSLQETNGDHSSQASQRESSQSFVKLSLTMPLLTSLDSHTLRIKLARCCCRRPWKSPTAAPGITSPATGRTEHPRCE